MQRCFANDIGVGLGGFYDQRTFENSTSSSNSIYRGPGVMLDFRYRLKPDRLSTTVGLDVFATIDMNWGSNINSANGENLSSFNYGGGLDVRLGWFFLGGQYSAAKLNLSSSSQSVALNYGSLGLRGGMNIPLSDDLELSVFGIYSHDVASARDNNLSAAQPIQEVRGILLLRYTLIRGWLD